MNWQTIIQDIRRHMTLQEIADACKFASRGHLHALAMGTQKSVEWSKGQALLRLHKRMMRRVAR